MSTSEGFETARTNIEIKPARVLSPIPQGCVGADDGTALGVAVGSVLGEEEGTGVGELVGETVGTSVGTGVIRIVGFGVGLLVGEGEGN